VRVLLATDFYLSSVTARDLVANLAWPRGVSLEVVHVLPSPARVSWFAGGSYSAAVLTGASDALRSFGAPLQTKLAAINPDLTRSVLVGHAAWRIVERAIDTQADLVVIGGPGRAELSTDTPSDFTLTVVMCAPCSVLVARTPLLDGLVPGMSARAERAGILDAAVLRPLRESSTPPRMPLTVVAAAHEASAAEARALARALGRTRGSVLVARERPSLTRMPRQRTTVRVGG